eukprot:6081165-Pleurochrysis_carterae.AAC.1
MSTMLTMLTMCPPLRRPRLQARSHHGMHSREFKDTLAVCFPMEDADGKYVGHIRLFPLTKPLCDACVSPEYNFVATRPTTVA